MGHHTYYRYIEDSIHSRSTGGLFVKDDITIFLNRGYLNGEYITRRSDGLLYKIRGRHPFTGSIRMIVITRTQGGNKRLDTIYYSNWICGKLVGIYQINTKNKVLLPDKYFGGIKFLFSTDLFLVIRPVFGVHKTVLTQDDIEMKLIK